MQGNLPLYGRRRLLVRDGADRLSMKEVSVFHHRYAEYHEYTERPVQAGKDFQAALSRKEVGRRRFAGFRSEAGQVLGEDEGYPESGDNTTKYTKYTEGGTAGKISGQWERLDPRPGVARPATGARVFEPR